MRLFSAFLFGISANMDAFVLGLSYGIKRQHIPITTNLLISLITFAGTLLALLAALPAAAFFPDRISRIAGSTLLILMGLFYCFKFIWEKWKKRHFPTISAQSEAVMSRREAALIGLFLTANNAAMGIGAGFAGIHFLFASLLTLLLCFLFLIAGNYLGRRWTCAFIGRFADLISGIIIVFLGISELVR